MYGENGNPKGKYIIRLRNTQYIAQCYSMYLKS